MGPKKEKNQNIQVIVRCRPLNGSEKRQGSYCILGCNPEQREISIKERPLPTAATKTFHYDRVFGPNSKQIEVYKSVVSPLLDEVLMGYNCTIFAYGQTGTGKTYTMEGDRSEDPNISWQDDPQAGMIPRAMHNLFARLQAQQVEYTVRVSYLEIYNEELIDLLGAETVENPRLKIYEDASKKGSCVIQGLEEVLVRDRNEVYRILEMGRQRRQTAATLMNDHSSRSHTLFMVTIHIKENSVDGEEMLKTGKLNLVDLAGSECIGRSGAVDRRAREAGNINQSLLTLGRVITCLVEHAPHVPYRESKLTRLLQDSLGGRTKTSIIATISPASINFEETLSTLDYAHRAKNIQNRPEINQRLTKKALLKEYTEEMERLRRDLQAARDKNGIFLAQENYDSMTTELQQQKDAIRDLEERIQMINLEMLKVQELFTETKEELEATTTQLHETQNTLTTTQRHLRVTTRERDEQKHLVTKHVDTEKVLGSQAEQLLTTADNFSSDVEKLHAKVDRTKMMEKHNLTTVEEFRNQFKANIDVMQTSLSQFTEGQLMVNNNLTASLGQMMEKREGEVKALLEDLGNLQALVAERNSGLTTSINTQQEGNLLWTSDIKNVCTKKKSEDEERHQAFLSGDFAAVSSRLEEQLTSHTAALQEFSQLLNKQLEEQHSMIVRYGSTYKDLLLAQDCLLANFNQEFTSDIRELRKSREDLAATHKHMKQGFADKLIAMIQDMVLQENELHNQETQKIGEKCDTLTTRSQDYNLETEKWLQELRQTTEKQQAELESLTSQHNTRGQQLLENMVQEQMAAVSATVTDVRSHVTSFSEQSLEARQRETQELADLLNLHEAELTEYHNTHSSIVKNLTSECELATRTVSERESGHQGELVEWCGEERVSLEENRQGVADWSEAMKEQLEKRSHEAENLAKEEIKPTPITGHTPQRKEVTYPRRLARTDRHSLILEEFRHDYNLQEAMNVPIPDDSFTSQVSEAPVLDLGYEDKGADSQEEMEELNGSTDSAFSTSSRTSSVNDIARSESKENIMGPPKVVSKVRNSSKTRNQTNSTGHTRSTSNSSNGQLRIPSGSRNTPKATSEVKGNSKLPLRASNQ